jgi:hypothetical protein
MPNTFFLLISGLELAKGFIHGLRVGLQKEKEPDFSNMD